MTRRLLQTLRTRLAPIGLLVSLVAASTAAIAAAPTAPAAGAARAPELASDSVYQLAATLTDQDGRAGRLDERLGHPVLVTMFYTSCQFVCPMIVEALRDTEAKLGAEERKHVSVLMVSIDPEHDSVAVLRRTADERGLDTSRWTLARTDATTVRKLAAVLGVQYRALPDGEFNHTTAVILLGADGRIVARTTRLGSADPSFVKRVKAAIQASAL